LSSIKEQLERDIAVWVDNIYFSRLFFILLIFQNFQRRFHN
jgi:hypothetical protein